jgi:hypothetical protein
MGFAPPGQISGFFHDKLAQPGKLVKNTATG